MSDLIFLEFYFDLFIMFMSKFVCMIIWVVLWVLHYITNLSVDFDILLVHMAYKKLFFYISLLSP